ncbi:MAG TPA: hypothetical protein VGS98_04590 [Thermoanaerobaculia bacterium]|nr:hypothetical protein [Thermoanaerobaculia bacterium]
MTVFAEAPTPSQLFGYYLLDTNHFQPNVFTAIIPGINDGAFPTGANCANRGLPTLASVRLVVEPKPGLPTDPNDPGAFIDIFTDISGLFVINNESGWYEGWMIHDLEVPSVAAPRPDGHAQFGKITAADATAVAALGGHHNVPGQLFTTDGNVVRFPSAGDHFPDNQSNLVPIQLSMGAYNCLQQADCHAYWEFNQYTDWVFPQYELPFTGGLGNSFAQGKVAFLSSVVPGSGPAVTGPTGPGPTGGNDPTVYGDNPDNPRDPDRATVTSLQDLDCPQPPDDEHAETRNRFIPSGLANEILLDVYVRLNSFEPLETDLNQRLFKANAAEVARIDENGDGVLAFEEADEEDESDGLPNERLYIPATQFERFAVTRELNDGLLAPRFAPSQRAWVLSAFFTPVSPAVPASIPQDADNR